MKVKWSFGHKAVILSLSKLIIKSKNSLNYSVWYTIWECLIKKESYPVPWPQSNHLVTFWTNHRIKKLLLQNMFSFEYTLRVSHKKWKLRSHLVTFETKHWIKKTSLTKLFVLACYLGMSHEKWNYAVIWSQSSHFVTV